ncbi:MAG: RNA 2',3'-cyclic phosphodiesterase [Candidatus Bathyarchaeota archaeon]|nr:MAG: RNA 2',3'-cyclic phosphodiesterase [Candidatus Bathyarchaeota archaeon]
MAESIRSFIAFDIDSEEILRAVSEVQKKLAESGGDLKLVAPSNIHLTIRFLGTISPGDVDRIFHEMEKVAFSPFDVEISGVGVFPNLNRPRVIWMGLQKGADELRGIFRQLEPRLQSLGFKPERRFSSHITLARVRSARNRTQLINFITLLKNRRFGLLRLNSLKLKKSVLTPKGPIYSTLREVSR